MRHARCLSYNPAVPPTAKQPRPPRPDRIAYAMRAMGKSDPPETLAIDGLTWRRTKIVKHDFFAATAFYHQPQTNRRAVLKISRSLDFAGVPLAWLGRWLCRRELRFYRALADLPNIPAILATVGQTGFVHDYVPGRPLSRDRPVPDGFFDQLQELLAEMHRRNLAYVDTNKPENILLGDDGRPHLIDFQISVDLTDFGDNRLTRWVLRHFQQADFYHVLKHKKRLRRDEITPAELEAVTRRSPLIRLHRWVFKPYFRFRRRTFERLRQSGRLLPEGSK